VNVGSLGKEMAQKKNEAAKKAKIDVAKMIGEAIAVKAQEKGIKKVVFDRKGYPFHGRIKAMADAARAKGLQF
jgi:large subunit ribosomal protein L18